MIKTKAKLKFVSAPSIEAAEIYEKMRDEKSQRLALYSLAKYLHEAEFIDHFIAIGGLRDLLYIIENSAGNILAYSLIAMQNLMDNEFGWEDLGSSFIQRVVKILASPNTLINVCRPATAILRRFVEADPRSAPGPAAGSSKHRPSQQRTVFRYGFDRVYGEMQKAPTMLEVVAARLGSGDSFMKLNSMMLINSLLSHVTEARWEQLTGELERLGIRKAVLSLMPGSLEDHLTSSILDFQGNLIRVAYRRKTTPVDPLGNPAHTAALTFIWEISRLQEEVAVVHMPNGSGRGTRHVFKWRRIGFGTEDLRAEFDRVGVLGLECLVCRSAEQVARRLMLPFRNTSSTMIRTTLPMSCWSKSIVRQRGDVQLLERRTRLSKCLLTIGLSSGLAVRCSTSHQC